jgi:GNAT superfamily N-acetyltransferase
VAPDPATPPSWAVVRPAGDEDVAALASLRAISTQERSPTRQDAGDTGDAAFVHRFASWYAAEPHRRFWIAEVEDYPVGMLNMLEFVRMPRPAQPVSRWGYIANVFVLEAHRDAGIGGRLLDAALAWARARDYARVVLSPSPRSVPLYARAGFGPAINLMALPVADEEL